MGDLQKDGLGPAVKREKHIMELPAHGRAQGALQGQEVSWTSRLPGGLGVDVFGYSQGKLTCVYSWSCLD